MAVILFVLSFLVLTLEVLETKIFAYSLANHLIFLVVGVVLLGFGAGGTALSLKRKLEAPRPLVRRNLFLTAILLVVAHVWFAIMSHRLDFAGDLTSIAVTVSILVLLAAPYFTAGMAISAMLADSEANVHARYAINLIGSALGCVSIFFILGPLTGPQCLMACAIICALLGVVLCQKRAVPLALVILLGTPAYLLADRILPYQIQGAQAGGQLALIVREAEKLASTNDKIQKIDVIADFDRWDPTARVQVHGLEIETSDSEYRTVLDKLPSKWFTQDSSYGSPLIGRNLDDPESSDDFFTRTVYGVGYFRKKPKPDVLCIGLGGAPDIQTALHHDPKSVDGVDINATTIAMARNSMADFLGRPYDDPRLTINVQDGRSFIRSSKDQYDLIQLSGVDTKTILASGTLALNESYLYTREAFVEYISHLTDDGILCIIYAGNPLRDRFAVTALEVLREEFDCSNPHKHLMMVEQSSIFCFLVKKTEFTEQECRQMDAWLLHCDSGGKLDAQGKPATDGLTGIVVMVYELLTPGLSLINAPKALFIPDGRETGVEVMREARKGHEALQKHVAERTENISPAPDWRPFFFNTIRNANIWSKQPGSEPVWSMFHLLFIMLALSLVLITGPLMVFGARGHGSSSGEDGAQGNPTMLALTATVKNIPFALYFAALGAGFILAMSGLIQRYVLFLGHQAYAFPAVIGGLLVAAGVGSFISGFFKNRPHLAIAIAVPLICAALAGLHYGLDHLFSTTAHMALKRRIVISVLVLIPLGVPLGMMFPTGLAMVKKTSPLFIPWAFGINGVFSVIGSTIVLPGAIMFGFPKMSMAAGLTYATAGLLGYFLAKRSVATHTP